MTFSVYSDIGGREENQDSVASQVTATNGLFMVADGLGGYSGGKIASAMVVEQLSEMLKGENVCQDTIEQSIQDVNTEIIKQQKDQLSSMKSTLALAYITPEMTMMANVGDTRIYAFKQGEIVFQSTDHSVTQMAVLMGEISQHEVRTHIDRNKLTRALGHKADVKVQKYTIAACDFDGMLLCSDGFWEDITEDDMCSCLKDTNNATDWLEKMKQKIKSKPGHDNHSAITILGKVV